MSGRLGRGNSLGRPAAHLRPVARPTMLDMAWAAGIFEGEGSVIATIRGLSITVVVVQKDPWILHRLKEVFGGSIDGPSARRDVSAWRIHGARARGFMYTTFSFLSPRRKAQFTKAMSGIHMNRGFSVTTSCATCGNTFSAAVSLKRRFCSPECYQSCSKPVRFARRTARNMAEASASTTGKEAA